MCRSWVCVDFLLLGRALIWGGPSSPLEFLDACTFPKSERAIGIYYREQFWKFKSFSRQYNDLGFLMMLPQAAALITSGITKILRGEKKYVIRWFLQWVRVRVSIFWIHIVVCTCWFSSHPCVPELGLRPERRWLPAGHRRRWLALDQLWRPRHTGLRLAPTSVAAPWVDCPCSHTDRGIKIGN